MKGFLKAGIFFTLPFLLGGCAQGRPALQQSAGTAMGTVAQFQVYTTSPQTDVTGSLLQQVRILEQEALSRRLETSQIWKVNELAGSGGEVELTERLGEVISFGLELGQASGGAFDIALGPLAALWDIDGWAGGKKDGEFTPPKEEAVAKALSRSGSRRVTFRPARLGNPPAIALKKEAALDLGALGKGAAMEELLSALEAAPSVTGAVLSLGGSVLTYGEKPDGTAWRVGVADPKNPSRRMGVLTLRGQWCVSTSGDYERYVEADGTRYHHILDPATGYPADSGLSAVTVVCKSGLLSDGLSTACFVLGREKGLALAAEYGAEALLVEKDGDVAMTPGMERLFEAVRED